jgi:hypothetical protein
MGVPFRLPTNKKAGIISKSSPCLPTAAKHFEGVFLSIGVAGWSWSAAAVAGHGWLWPVLAGRGWPWPAMAWLWPGCGRLERAGNGASARGWCSSATMMLVWCHFGGGVGGCQVLASVVVVAAVSCLWSRARSRNGYVPGVRLYYRRQWWRHPGGVAFPVEGTFDGYHFLQHGDPRVKTQSFVNMQSRRHWRRTLF